MIAGLLRVVTLDEQGRPIRWRVSRAELSDPVCTELDAFVARRLLSTDSTNDTVVNRRRPPRNQLDVAHPAGQCHSFGHS